MPTTANLAASREFNREELEHAREDVQQQAWTSARDRLRTLAGLSPATDPVGAEVRALLAQVSFELGDYEAATEAASQVPAASPSSAAALEYGGLARLFACDFDAAVQWLYRLRTAQPARGATWLGMSYAWTGANASAETELHRVVDQGAVTGEAANARFYLAQMAQWNNNNNLARTHWTALEQVAPNYLPELADRARNWSQRGTHLLRAFFTFDTLARRARAANPAAGDPELDDLATSTLAQLQQRAPQRCAAPVARLAQAFATRAAQRQRVAQQQASQPAQVRNLALAEQDSDGDGIPDARDRCPNEPETFNGVEDTDGCPETATRVELVGNQIRFRGGAGISFTAATSSLTPESLPVLEELRALLQATPTIRRVRLEGHTDDQGSERHNFELSEQRVVAVGAWLVGHGIPRERLEWIGYGETRPLVPGNTEDARARNRRVEILVSDPPMLGGVR